MSDGTWGEIFNLNEELKRIEEEVDRRLEETLAADPHVIEQETVHYGSQENYRMQQSMPTFEEPVETEAPVVEEAVEETVAVVEEASVAEEAVETEEPVAEEVPVEEAPAEEVPVEESPDEETPVEEASADEVTTEEPSVAEEIAEPVTEEPTEESKVIAFPGVEPEAAEADAPDENPDAETVEEPANEPAAESEETPAAEMVETSEIPATESVEDPATETTESAKTETVEAPETKTPEAPATESKQTTTATKAAPQDDNRRKVLIALVAAIVALAAIFGGLYVHNQQKPKAQYEEAQSLLDAGDYDGAIEAFTATHGYKDSAERIMEAQYAKASALVNDGSYSDAVDYIDSLSDPSDAMQNLRASAIYQTAVQDYADGALDKAVSELEQIADYETNGISASNLLNQIRYQQASEALAIYDFDAAEPILEALGDYEDAPILLQQVQNAYDVVYTDVARDDDGVEIAGKSEYLWVHSVITPGAIAAGSSEEEVTAALREMAGATDDIDDDWVRVLMMHQATTDAEMLYIDAAPIQTDKSSVVTMDISQYAGIDESFATDQIVYAPQTLQRSNTDFAIAFEGSEQYAGEDGGEVRMECKLADDGYWVKTRRVYAEMKNGKLVGVPQHQLRTWTKVTTESVANEVREAFIQNMTEQ